MPRSALATLATLVALAACDGRPERGSPLLTLVAVDQPSGTDALLQAVSPVSARVVWVSGHAGTYARTADGGANWEARVVPGAEALQFRDVAAFDESSAYLMSAGSGDESRIYRTFDGGTVWLRQYTADHPDAFLDCMDFWSPDRGIVYGDAVDGVPFLLLTENGGADWRRVPASALPPALEREGGFAASGTCVRALPGGVALVATGNGPRARILRTTDYGASWSVVEPPVVGGAAAGLTTVDVGSDGRGVALGGVIGNDSIRSDNVAVSADGGRTWTRGGAPAMAGPVYGAALAPGSDGLVVAVGPRGLDWSLDGGLTWRRGAEATYWAVAFADAESGWAVGPGGRITRLSLGPE